MRRFFTGFACGAIIAVTLFFNAAKTISAADSAIEELLSIETIVEIREASTSQSIALPDLLPGSKTKVEVKLRNSTGRDLILEEIRASCGCMVLGKVEKAFAAEQIITLPIDFKPPTKDGKFGNSLTIVDSDKNEWVLAFTSYVVSPLECDTKEFDINGTTEEVIKLTIRIGEDHKKIISELSSLKVMPHSEGVTGVNWEVVDGNRGILKFNVNLPKERLSGNRFSGGIRFSSAIFTYDLPLVFRFKDEPRVLLETVSRSRLRDGIQRIIVVGGEPTDRAELRVIAEDIQFVSELVKNGSNLSIFSIGTKDDISEVQSVQIGLVKDNAVVHLTSVKVVD